MAIIGVIAGVFLVLHGLVHLLYFGQSARLFELQPGMTWPAGSWAFSGLLKENRLCTLAGILCILAAAGFVVGGVGIIASQDWWRTVVFASAANSGILYLLFWNGQLQHLDNQGGIGLLIDLAILLVVLVVG